MGWLQRLRARRVFKGAELTEDSQDQVNAWVEEQNRLDGYTPAMVELLQELREIKEKL